MTTAGLQSCPLGTPVQHCFPLGHRAAGFQPLHALQDLVTLVTQSSPPQPPSRLPPELPLGSLFYFVFSLPRVFPNHYPSPNPRLSRGCNFSRDRWSGVLSKSRVLSFVESILSSPHYIGCGRLKMIPTLPHCRTFVFDTCGTVQISIKRAPKKTFPMLPPLPIGPKTFLSHFFFPLM